MIRELFDFTNMSINSQSTMQVTKNASKMQVVKNARIIQVTKNASKVQVVKNARIMQVAENPTKLRVAKNADVKMASSLDVATKVSQKNQIADIEMLYPNGVGPKSQNLKTFRASMVKWLKLSHEFSQLESIVRTGKYVSCHNQPREPIRVRNLLPIKPEYEMFEMNMDGFVSAMRGYSEGMEEYWQRKTISDGEEQEFRESNKIYKRNEHEVVMKFPKLCGIIFNQMSDASVELLCLKFNKTNMELLDVTNPEELMYMIMKTHSSEEYGIEEFKVVEEVKVFSMLQSVINIQDDTSAYKECLDHTVLTLGVAVNILSSIPGDICTADDSYDVQKLVIIKESTMFGVLPNRQSKQIQMEIKQPCIVFCKNKCIQGQEVVYSQNSIEVNAIKDVQEGFDKLKTEEFKNEEVSAIIDVSAKVNATSMRSEDTIISACLVTDVMECSSPDKFIGTKESDSCHNKASIATILDTSTLEQGNKVQVEQDMGVHQNGVHIILEVCISHMMRLPQGDEMFRQECNRCGIGDLYGYKLKKIKIVPLLSVFTVSRYARM